MDLMSQIPEAPSSLASLQWIIIFVLAGVVGTLFWQLQKAKEDCSQFRIEMMEKMISSLGEIDSSLSDVTTVLDALDKDLGLQKQISEIREDIRKRNGGNG